jgi:hypothetical protein
MLDVGFQQSSENMVMVRTDLFDEYFPLQFCTTYFRVLSAYKAILYYMQILFDKESDYQCTDMVWLAKAEPFREMALLLWSAQQADAEKTFEEAFKLGTHLSMLHAYEKRICYGRAIMIVLNLLRGEDGEAKFEACDYEQILKDTKHVYKQEYRKFETLSICPVKAALSRKDNVFEILTKQVKEDQEAHRRIKQAHKAKMEEKRKAARREKQQQQ